MPHASGREKTAARTAWLARFFDHVCDPGRVRTAYRCRAYPDEQQQAVLNRTFGCVRVVWNRTLRARQARWQVDRTGTSYAETDRALTAMKKDPALAFLTEVSCVPLQQSLRHQHAAFAAFFAGRARHPRFKNILAAGRAVAWGPPGDACGAGVRHSGSSRAAGGETGTPAGDG